jgi:hypothetical protein
LSISSGHVLHVEDGGLLATGQHRDGNDERDGCRKTLRMAGSSVEERRHPRHRQQACKDDNGKPEHWSLTPDRPRFGARRARLAELRHKVQATECQCNEEQGRTKNGRIDSTAARLATQAPPMPIISNTSGPAQQTEAPTAGRALQESLCIRVAGCNDDRMSRRRLAFTQRVQGGYA